jgi:integrase
VAARSKEVSSATVNRNVAVLKNLLTFAVERGYLQTHPLSRFRMLPEERRALRVMTLEEERRLVKEVAEADHLVGAYVAVLGETGLRKQEGLNLEWSLVDLSRKILSVEETKSKRPRSIPLSDYAIEWLQSLVRVIDSPFVFVRLDNHQPLRDPRVSFDKGKKAAGLDWVTFHDLRHFRATQWLRSGIDVRTVQELLGHSAIQTTMRYLHLVDGTFKAVREAQERETFGRH